MEGRKRSLRCALPGGVVAAGFGLAFGSYDADFGEVVEEAADGVDGFVEIERQPQSVAVTEQFPVPGAESHRVRCYPVPVVPPRGQFPVLGTDSLELPLRGLHIVSPLGAVA